MSKKPNNDHVPVLFPKFIGKGTWRTLALYHNHELLLESGQRYEIACTDDLAQLLFDLNLLCFVQSILDLPEDWLDLGLEHGDIWCTEDGTPRALRLHGPRNTTRWLAQSDAWGYKAPELEMLSLLRQVFNRAQVGTVTTPGALGIALLKQSWRQQFGDEWRMHRHQRPPEGVCLWLAETCTGARNDFEPEHEKTVFSVLKEIDLKNGYGFAFSQGVPTGASIGFRGGHCAHFATYYAYCEVAIREPLSYGLFPVRRTTASTVETVYPTQPGIYTTTLWKEEIERLRARGLEVVLGGGEGWSEMTQEPALFVQTLEKLRDDAPETLKPFFKLALVTGIGRLGLPSVSYTLTEEETETRVAFDGRAFDLFVQKHVEKRPESMPHWFYYILMKCRLIYSEEAEKWKEQEMLLGGNTDGLYLSSAADLSTYPTQAEKATQPSGTWIAFQYEEVRLPYSRGFISTTKVSLPHIPKDEKVRKKYLAKLQEEDVPY